MKSLHRPDLFCWSTFDEARDIDFHSIAWIRGEGHATGNVLIDPLPLSEHDRRHLERLGGAAWILLTNSDHVRDAQRIAEWTGAEIAGPRAEASTFPIACDRWLGDLEEAVPGLLTLEMHGSKTPGELCFLLEGSTLITGDLLRSHRAGELMLLPAAKLKDRAAAVASLRRLLEYPQLETILVGDGWPTFQNARERLRTFLDPFPS